MSVISNERRLLVLMLELIATRRESAVQELLVRFARRSAGYRDERS